MQLNQLQLGTVRTLMHRAETLIAHEERRKIEKEKVRAPLKICVYPERALKGGKQRGKRQFRKDEEKQRGRDQIEDGKSKQYAVLPYMKGVTERLQRAFRKTTLCPVCQGRLYYQKCCGGPQGSIRQWQTMCSHIWCACDVCGELYVGETGRLLEIIRGKSRRPWMVYREAGPKVGSQSTSRIVRT